LFAPSTNHKYRPDIDGLRAVAVLSVVSYHAFPLALTGGFVGLDVFFVISGFLITSILIGDIETHSFSPLAFYARRIRRIFPALAVCLVAVLIYGSFALTPDMRFPGWLALVPALGAVTSILAGPAALVNNHVLSRPVLVRIGLLSYPLYVWHWPPISFAYVVRQGKPPTPLLARLRIGCAFLLASITYRFVEKPVRFRSGNRLTAATTIVFGALVCAAWGCGRMRDSLSASRSCGASTSAK
jgi:peptidoglycan/LPS O-acetylase OafA/YrhL